MPRLRLAVPLLLVLALATTAWGAVPRSLEGVVVRVVDGDTIHVRIAEGVEKVRYIGVNTPEVHHPRLHEQPGGREAWDVNRRLVAGRRVRLELDVQARDRYGRLLAYVSRVGDAETVNARLIEAGAARTLTIAPNTSLSAQLSALQHDARAAGRGLWSAC